MTGTARPVTLADAVAAELTGRQARVQQLAQTLADAPADPGLTHAEMVRELHILDLRYALTDTLPFNPDDQGEH
ncbi:MAG: hypothetical protein ACR2JO_09930 [Mycobacteriales bacterium]